MKSRLFIPAQAIKYKVWSSTVEGNKRLNEAFKLTTNLFLFFSVNGSGRFCGLAQMRSRVDFEKHLPHWEEDQKWKGLFYLEWIFVKDIPNKNLRYITNKYLGGFSYAFVED